MKGYLQIEGVIAYEQEVLRSGEVMGELNL